MHMTKTSLLFSPVLVV